jgi:glycosyltransferase involved in cell wall biosynthesis
MRILIATDHFPPYIGGAHRQTQLLARAMAGRGHTVAVAAPWHGGLPKLEHDDGFVVHRVRQVRTAFDFMVRDRRQRHQPPFPDPVTVAGLHFLIADFEPDVIHAYGWLAFSVAVAMGRKRIPLLVSARDYGYFCATRTLLRKGAPCSGPAPVKCLLCAGDYYGVPKGWFAALGVALSKPLLARPGDEAPDIDAWLGRLPREPFILFVGAFSKVKGLETLFEAYRRLDSPPPLVLMGTFERDSPADFPPEAIILTDVPHQVVMAAWDRALFGVMPSLWPEPLGATVAEGMSRGRPVIGTSRGGHTDMLDEETGILVPQGDPEALAAAMRELVEDPARREALGRAAAERAESFAAPSVLPRFEDAYRSTISAGPAKPG